MINQRPSGFPPAAQFKGDNAAKPALLPFRQLMLRVRRQARIINPLDGRLCLQPLRQVQGCFAVRPHPQAQGFQSLEKHPGVERTHGGSGGAEKAVNIHPYPLLIADHGPADAAALPIQIFGGGMNDQIRAQLERLLQGRSAEAVVHHQ